MATVTEEVDERVGVILFHKDYGYCRILDVNRQSNIMEVQFCGTERRIRYSFSSFGRDLIHKPLPLESYASVSRRGTCQIIKIPPPGARKDFFRYVVRFDETGDTAEVEERKLVPIDSHPKETLFSRMASCDSHSLYKVIARHKFLHALEDLYKATGGLEALIGSRIELYPHQAFVAGTVINDSIRRFILADEVGLGKTIEAGLVVNDILAAKPDARVLILTPGALSRQWLCELHMSFGAQGFKLADLHQTIRLAEWRKIISSINRAVFDHREDFERVPKWDLVVVDEAHHLLWNNDAYTFIEKLSRKTNGLLLLSAVPAREREDELLRLLRLLDPDRYKDGQKITKRFADLYRAQPQLGQGLRILDSDIADIKNGEASPKDLELPLARIMGVPIVEEDKELKKFINNITKLPTEKALVQIQQFRDLIVNRYRLSRRIIKNRRSQLISEELFTGVSREYELLSYEPDGFEIEAWSGLEAILEQLSKSKASVFTKHQFFRTAYLAMSDPVCASFLAEELTKGLNKKTKRMNRNLLETAYGISYDEYYDFLEDLSTVVSPYLKENSVKKFSDSVNAWIDTPNSNRRYKRLLGSLSNIFDNTSKLIIFAGAYGLAESLAEVLKEKLGNDVVEVFAYDLSDTEKEENVLRFRTKNECRILVSDETGGEGRNFQFADAIVHYDLPWSVASIEQRIGRLDRIGRKNSVRSYLLFRSNSIEEGFISCLLNGFRVFSTSISGLEFMLRDSESSMVDKAYTLDWEQLASMASQIAVVADKERRIDDAEALTDAGSFPGLGKVRVLHEISDPLEQRLEGCFVEYFRCLARRGSAHQHADRQDPRIQLWLLRPDEIRNEPLPGIEKERDGFVAERRGTFRRRIARERRNIEFFSVGNPLFDAVSNVALHRLSGRVFALGVRDPKIEAGNYTVFGMRCVVAPNSIEDSIPLQRRVRRYIFGKRFLLVYRLGETVALNSTSLESVIKSSLNGNSPSVDLTRRGFHEIVTNAVPDWPDYIMWLKEAVYRDARAAYKRAYEHDHQSMLRELQNERSELERSANCFGSDVEALLTLEHALEEWQPVIDVIGITQVRP